jgi:hypothetical protein
MISRMIAVMVLLANLAHAQSHAPDISFLVTREGEIILTDARVDLPVITDYEGYPRFISSMHESKVISRSPEGSVVEQKGHFSFMFFSQGIEARLVVSEFPPDLIVTRAIEGDFLVMNGRYELRQIGNHARLSYSGRLVPKFSLPPLFGLSIVRYILLRNFREMVDEILRRDAEVHRVIRADG